MIRAPNSDTSDSCWESVSSKLPCPVCGADTGCRLHSEEPFVLCAQTPSDWPLTTGGWLHRDVVATRNRCSSGVYATYDVDIPRKALASRSLAPLLASLLAVTK